MEVIPFIDYYEILEISPNANAETIERIFRYLAQRYHPDNQDTGDHLRFSEVVQAHKTLRDPVKRAQYDIQHKIHSDFRWKLAEEASDKKTVECDIDIQENLLSILYVKRRRNMESPGVGNLDLERLSGCPKEHLDFHLWYLKEKGWISRMDNGLISITVHGIDHINLETKRITAAKLLTDQHASSV
jgi:curved DNA-binding protein CbpA